MWRKFVFFFFLFKTMLCDAASKIALNSFVTFSLFTYRQASESSLFQLLQYKSIIVLWMQLSIGCHVLCYSWMQSKVKQKTENKIADYTERQHNLRASNESHSQKKKKQKTVNYKMPKMDIGVQTDAIKCRGKYKYVRMDVFVNSTYWLCGDANMNSCWMTIDFVYLYFVRISSGKIVCVQIQIAQTIEIMSCLLFFLFEKI